MVVPLSEESIEYNHIFIAFSQTCVIKQAFANEYYETFLCKKSLLTTIVWL
jgi:hypothetical protein